jgi:hypothetical protein
MRVSQARTVPSCKRNIQITSKIRCRWCQNYSATSSCFSIYVYTFEHISILFGHSFKYLWCMFQEFWPLVFTWTQMCVQLETGNPNTFVGISCCNSAGVFPPRRNHDLVKRNNLKIFATNLRLCENGLLL